MLVKNEKYDPINRGVLIIYLKCGKLKGGDKKRKAVTWFGAQWIGEGMYEEAGSGSKLNQILDIC